MQIQISWLLQKPTDLDLHCLQMQGISGPSKTRVNIEIQYIKGDFKAPFRIIVDNIYIFFLKKKVILSVNHLLGFT